jgi:hypothetical protein
MADSWVIVALKVGRAAENTAGKLLSGAVGSQGKDLGRQACNTISKLLDGAAGGAFPANLYAAVINDGGTKASGTIACTQANAANDTVTFTFGAKTVVLTEGVDFLRGGTNTNTAANLAAAINAHSVLKRLMSAAGSTGNCVITAKLPTQLAYSIVLTTNDATAFGLTQFASATVGTAQHFIQHFDLGRSA